MVFSVLSTCSDITAENETRVSNVYLIHHASLLCLRARVHAREKERGRQNEELNIERTVYSCCWLLVVDDCANNHN